jgi:hypothetical protein
MGKQGLRGFGGTIIQGCFGVPCARAGGVKERSARV